MSPDLAWDLVILGFIACTLVVAGLFGVHFLARELSKHLP